MLLRMSGCGTFGVCFANVCCFFLRRMGQCLELQLGVVLGFVSITVSLAFLQLVTVLAFSPLLFMLSCLGLFSFWEGKVGELFGRLFTVPLFLSVSLSAHIGSGGREGWELGLP